MLSPRACEPAACRRTLTGHLDQLRYDTALAGDWAIPPAPLQAPAATCRLARPHRARGGLPGAEAVLRAVVANGDFDLYWRHYARASMPTVTAQSVRAEPLCAARAHRSLRRWPKCAAIWCAPFSAQSAVMRRSRAARMSSRSVRGGRAPRLVGRVASRVTQGVLGDGHGTAAALVTADRIGVGVDRVALGGAGWADAAGQGGLRQHLDPAGRRRQAPCRDAWRAGGRRVDWVSLKCAWADGWSGSGASCLGREELLVTQSTQRSPERSPVRVNSCVVPSTRARCRVLVISVREVLVTGDLPFVTFS